FVAGDSKPVPPAPPSHFKFIFPSQIFCGFQLIPATQVAQNIDNLPSLINSPQIIPPVRLPYRHVSALFKPMRDRRQPVGGRDRRKTPLSVLEALRSWKYAEAQPTAAVWKTARFPRFAPECHCPSNTKLETKFTRLRPTGTAPRT